MKKGLLFLGLLFLPLYYTNAGMCDDFVGAELVSPDGTYLGVLDASKFNTNSIGNTFGDYGSRFGDNSIFNRFGDYGSRFEDTSPRNRFATKPPLIKKGGTIMGTLTLNRFADGAQNTFDILYCFIPLSDSRREPFEGLNPGWHATSYYVPGNNFGGVSFDFTAEESCQLQYGSNATAGDPGYCKCKLGFKWNSSNTACIAMTDSELCQLQYGPNSTEGDPGMCKCKEGYGWNSNKTSCVRMSEDEKCQLEFGNNSYSPAAGYCDCINGYERNSSRTSCVKVSRNYDQECRDTYGAYSIASPTDPANFCTCKDGYVMNKEKTYCIPASNDCKDRYGQYATYSNGSCTCLPGYVQPRDGGQCVTEQESCTLLYGMGAYLSSPGQCSCKVGYHRNNNTTLCVQDTNTPNTFSAEFKDAYEFAYANKITTMPTIEEANMNGQIIRAEIAKMLANRVKSLGYIPDTSAKCNFTDIGGVKGDLYTAIIESCQLGIMGQGITKFRPFDNITRGEVATAISRILWGHQYDGGNPYYESHLNALRASGILSDTSNPDFKELRGNVMVMLMRASVDGDVECDDPLIVLACVDNGEDCPEICRSDYDVNKVIDYNNKVIEIAQNCISSQDEILEEAEKDNASSDKVKKLTNNTIDKCKEAILGLNKLGDWNGDDTLKNGVLLVVASNIAYYKEFLKLVPFLDIDNMTSSQEKEYNEITSKLEDLNLKLDKVNEDLMMIQEKFAKKHGFELEG